MRVAAVLICAMPLCLLMRPSQTAPAYAGYVDPYKAPVCKAGLLSGTYLVSRGLERDKLHHRVEVLRKEKVMMLDRICKAERARVAPTGSPDEIETVDDLVDSIVSIVENDTRVEATSSETETRVLRDPIETTTDRLCAGGVATGKELFRIGKETKALEMARDKLLAEMSAMKETLTCPDVNGNTVSDETRRRIREAVQAFVITPRIAANGVAMTNDVIATTAPTAMDPEQVTCHDEVETSGRNSFWTEDPITSPFVFDIKTQGRVYLRLSPEKGFLPNIIRIATFPWTVKIHQRTETRGQWQEKASSRWADTSTEIWRSEEFVRMWISWTDDGTVSLYSSKLQGRPLVNWTDPDPLPINYLGYSTVFAPGVFRFNCN